MRKSTLAITLIMLVGLGVSDQVDYPSEHTAPAPDQDKIIEELDEHWEEDIFPDFIQDVSEKFESFDLGIPVK